MSWDSTLSSLFGTIETAYRPIHEPGHAAAVAAAQAARAAAPTSWATAATTTQINIPRTCGASAAQAAPPGHHPCAKGLCGCLKGTRRFAFTEQIVYLQDEEAGRVKEAEGDILVAITLFMKGGLPGHAADSVNNHPSYPFPVCDYYLWIN